jgi:hypothetical protein
MPIEGQSLFQEKKSSSFFLLFKFSFYLSLLFVIDTQIAIFADSLCIEGSVSVFTLRSHLSPALRMVAISAHTICIIRFGFVTTGRDIFSVLMLGLGRGFCRGGG